MSEQPAAGGAEVPVTEALLPGGTLGYYDPDRNEIVLDSRLGAAERRSTLAHERAHAARGHWNCAGDGPDGARLAARWERVAESDAARALIPLHDLARALLWTRDDTELAEHFHVDVATVVARRAGLTAGERRSLSAAVKRAGRWSA